MMDTTDVALDLAMTGRKLENMQKLVKGRILFAQHHATADAVVHVRELEQVLEIVEELRKAAHELTLGIRGMQEEK